MPKSTDAAWFNSLVQFGCFGSGALLSLQLRVRATEWKRSTRLAAAFSTAVLWLVASYAFHLQDHRPPSAINIAAGYLAVEVGCVLLLLSIIGVSAKRLPRPFIYLGRISFGLYVFHALSLHIAFSLLARMRMVQTQIPAFFLGLAITILLAAASYRFYETPF